MPIAEAVESQVSARAGHDIVKVNIVCEKDIGPGVTHREWVVRLWLEGKDLIAPEGMGYFRINH